MDIKREDLICKDCMSPSTSGFKKIISLKNSGLLIYLHSGEKESKNYNTLKKEKSAAGKSKSHKIFILHNDSGHDLRRPDYAIEMCQPRTRCFRCINLIKHVRSLLDELDFIGKNQIIGLCEHCKRNPGACKRCQYIVSKFLKNKTELHNEKQNQFKTWLNKVNQFLHHVLNNENVDRGQINSDPSALELERLLQELKQPLRMKNLHTAFFPTDLAQLSSITAGNEMIDDLLTKIKAEGWEKSGLEEDLPLVDKSIQLQSKESEKIRPRQLPPLSTALQNKRFHEWVEKDKASEMTTKGFSSKLLENDNVLRKKSEVKPRNLSEPYAKKAAKKGKVKVISGITTNKEKNKIISEKSTKSSTFRPTVKGDALKDQSDDKPSMDAKSHRKEMTKKERNRLISTMAEESDEIFSRNQSQNKLGSTTESPRQKEIIIDKTQPTPERSTKGSRKILNEGDSNENQNSNATHAKVKNRSDVSSKVSHNSELKDVSKNIPLISSGKDIDILTLIKIYQKGKNLEKNIQNTTNPFANMELPTIEALAAAAEDENLLSYGSISDGDQHGPDLITEMIKSTEIVKHDPHYKDNLLNISETESNILPNLFEHTVKQKQHSADGVLRYKLSNKAFINKGYTILPIIQVMKRVNVYKMEPVNPHFNWFQRHKGDRTKNYDTGEILAEIKENGTGRWFYKNGRIALDYYNAEEACGGQRFVLYSSGEEIKQDQGARLKELKNKPQVLGVFDHLGNGAVFDIYGNERLKYNQTEGLVLDSKIGPVCHWKWHSLNDPPILEPVVKDNYVHPCSKHLPQKDPKEYLDKRQKNPEVLKAELQIFAKKKAAKLLQKFKPYHIRMKAFKINDEFSLRIIDQAYIYLMFRHGTVSMKLNLGLQLVSNEIVDTDAAEVGSVATPYDRIPPRSNSIADIQHTLHYARNLSQRNSKTSNRLSSCSSTPCSSSKSTCLLAKFHS